LFAYSDMTGLQLLLLDRLGLPAFHGPMVAADFYREDGIHTKSFRSALAGQPYSLGREEGLRTLRRGNARGTLYGGCLSILVSLIGTSWEPATQNKLLFIEDVGAKPYQVDRMLWQLREAGKLDGVRGFIFGEMLDCSSSETANDLLEEAILSALKGLDVPVAFGLRSGHVSRENVTLIFGVEAELEAGDDARLALIEPAVKQ
jgi:muramoyltetrapeptide carboxypeptidase